MIPSQVQLAKYSFDGGKQDREVAPVEPRPCLWCCTETGQVYFLANCWIKKISRRKPSRSAPLPSTMRLLLKSSRHLPTSSGCRGQPEEEPVLCRAARGMYCATLHQSPQPSASSSG